MQHFSEQAVLALAGGVGGAKLAYGMQAVLGSQLSMVVNTADDFTHWGLHISPDVDTVLYNLAGIENPATGWGLANESWTVLGEMQAREGESWFRLGDRDLATHLLRTSRLQAGATLTEVTHHLAHVLGVSARVLPMCDQPVQTLVHTSDAGTLAFQEYFVRRACQPKVTGFEFAGHKKAIPTPALLAAFAGSQPVIICPSNPFVSIAPILALPGVQAAFARRVCPVVAVSPIVGGQAIKGPAAKMFAELGQVASAAAVVDWYGGLLDGFVLDQQDADLAPQLLARGLAVLVTDTLMPTAARKIALAEQVLLFARAITTTQNFAA